MQTSIIGGVDIGGSHITAALVDISSRTIIEHTWKRAPVNAQGSITEIMTGWCNVINACFEQGNIVPERLGIAIPGPFDYDKGISLMQNQAKYDALYGVNIKEMLSDKLSLATENITFVNDAASFLQGERFSGAAVYCERVIGITLGTGLGSAINNGHHTWDANLWCSPFLDGVAEDYLSSRWFVKRYFLLSGKKKRNVKEIMTSLHADAAVTILLDEFARNLASFLIPIIEAEKTEMVVLGGNISHAFDYFSDTLKKLVNELMPEVKIERNRLGESAALIGAASSNNLRHIHNTNVLE